MESMVTERVPGATDTTIYPYIRKIDLMSSNSYIISGPGQIAIIDPGGQEQQMDHLEEVISLLQDEQRRPVVVYLTHVHLDHWIQMRQDGHGTRLQDAFLAVQENGAEALEKGDDLMTLSGLLGRSMKRVPVDFRLLTKLDKLLGVGSSFDLKGQALDTAIKSREIAEGIIMHSQVVPLGGDDILEIYHTPGHSPDSISLRIGALLIVGDIFFAPNPGMAGAYGWSRRDLMDSIRKVLWILENENVTICCSGHGRTIDAETARKTLAVMYSDASSLKDLEEINPRWARCTADYAQDLVRELERLFTIIGGRLAFIAHVFGELQEEARAEELNCLLDPKALDELFIDFHGFAKDLKAGKKLDLELVHKAGQVVGKVESLFQRKRLGSVMDRYLLGRVGKLLSDYSITYRGYRPPYYVSIVDVNRLVLEMLKQLKSDPYEEEAILLAESEEEYLEALRARIAHVNLFEGVELAFCPDADMPVARMDRERFQDTFRDILERFAVTGTKKINIATDLSDGWALMRIACSGQPGRHPLDQALGFFERNLALCGGLLHIYQSEEGPAAEIEFSAMSEDGSGSETR
ncbi:MAG TPA: MBL fold metallo-hydrolase [Methanothrix sp.]|nr:MBL fold metallo-hydrolase [Methanothrix sp.]